MIEITINYQGEQITSFEVKGHAGYADEGQDIYCAGISAITQTALVGLGKHLSVPPGYQVEKGWLSVQLADSLTAEDMEKAQIILSTMEAGLLSLQETYKKYIQVFIRRC